jgi:hypothetical protein
MNRLRGVAIIGCAVLSSVSLGACGSESSALSTTTTSKAHTSTDLPVRPATAACTALALQAALPSGTTIVTTDLAFRCEGNFAGAEINQSSPEGAASGYTSDTLFQMRGSTWVDIGRSLTSCRIVPHAVHIYCTVS